MHMFKSKLEKIIKDKNSLLCIGLDCDIEKIPRFLLDESDPLLSFNKEIINATSEYAIAYKPNISFYEALGIPGWNLLEKTLAEIPHDILTIADAKRSDIGNSSIKYADLFFNMFGFDAITVSPYMGFDSIQPFLEFDDRCTFILCLTSNEGSRDFQYLNVDSEPLFIKIARKVTEWNLTNSNCGLVVGATHPEDIGSIREIAPHLPFLIPGIGIQGGNLKLTIQYGTDDSGGCTLINVGRSILYASSQKNFAEQAREKARFFKEEINSFRLQKRNQQ